MSRKNRPPSLRGALRPPMRGASSWSPDSVESDAVSDSTSDSKAVSDSTSDSDERGRAGRLRLRVPRGGDRRAGRRAFTQGAKAPGEMSAIQKTSRRTTVAPPPTSRKRSTQRLLPPPTSRKRSTQRSPPVASTRAFLLREGTNAGEPPPPPPRPPSSAPASPLLRPPKVLTRAKKADRWVSVVGGPRGASPVFRGWGGRVFSPPASACPFPMRSRSRAGASRCRRRPLRRPSATPAPGPRAPQPLPSFVAGAVCGRRSRRAFMCAGETRPPPPGPAPGAARSRARRQCSHFALIIYIYWDEVRTLRVLTSFTRRPRPLGAVPPAGQWGGGKAGGPWAARRPVGPGVRRAGPGARGRPTGARGSYLITAEPGSRGPGPAPGPFLVSMRNGSGNRRIGR